MIGKAELEVTPDLIYLRIFISEKDTKNKIPVAQLETKMFESLKSLGIDVTKDLLVQDMSSSFRNYLLSTSEILLSREYQLLVRDATTAAKVFIELEKIEISNISIEKLDHTKMEEYRNEVKVNAIKAGKEKAKMLAVAIDQGVGKALFVQEIESGYFSPSNNRRFQADEFVSSKMMVDIEFNKIKLDYSVLCRFELK